MNMDQDELNTALDGLVEEQDAIKKQAETPLKERGGYSLKEFMDHIEKGTPLRELPPRPEDEERYFQAIVSALKSISEKHEDLLKAIKNGHKEGIIGNIDCPVCKKQIKYRISGYNGHIWGACETENCLRWMQ